VVRILAVALAMTAAVASAASAHVVMAAPPSTVPTDPAPPATNDLLPENNDVDNCVGTLESANCGSRARADGHTYLVFAALVGGLGFIGWRIGRSVRARDRAGNAGPQRSS
jgi:hypothetical protein